jgi:hypothetical protein
MTEPGLASRRCRNGKGAAALAWLFLPETKPEKYID